MLLLPEQLFRVRKLLLKMHFDFWNIFSLLQNYNKLNIMDLFQPQYPVFTHIELQSFPFLLIGYLKSQICNSLETNLGYTFAHQGDGGKA